MLTTKGVSSIGTQCIFRELVILRARVVSMSSRHLMNLLVAQGMLTIFIVTKPSKNILHFGMPVSIVHLVGHDTLYCNHNTDDLLPIRQFFMESLPRHFEIGSAVDSRTRKHKSRATPQQQ